MNPALVDAYEREAFVTELERESADLMRMTDAELDDLPRCLVMIAGEDIYRNEQLAWVDLCRQRRIDVKCVIFGGMAHGFLLWAEHLLADGPVAGASRALLDNYVGFILTPRGSTGVTEY